MFCVTKSIHTENIHLKIGTKTIGSMSVKHQFVPKLFYVTYAMIIEY